MTYSIKNLYRYPVKGLPADPMDSASLSVGEAFPYDRRYALAHASSRIDKASPEWAPKSEFLMLARDEKLAELGASFSEEDQTLALLRKGKQVTRGALSSSTGRSVLETFLAGFMPSGPRGNPTIVEAPTGDGFSDVPGKWISIINLDSVKDIGRVLQDTIDPLRFRGNIYVETGEAWAESAWTGKRVQIGEVILFVEEPIGRCAATNIDPSSGKADHNVPLTLRRGFGHTNCGIYARVTQSGTIKPGDTLEILE